MLLRLFLSREMHRRLCSNPYHLKDTVMVEGSVHSCALIPRLLKPLLPYPHFLNFFLFGGSGRLRQHAFASRGVRPRSPLGACLDPVLWC